MKGKSEDVKRKILHYISKTGTFMFLYGLIYMIIEYTIGLILGISDKDFFGGASLSVPLISIATLFVIGRCFKISSPYDRH